MVVDLNRLRHIVAISRTQSFSRAAEELHITQPALSRSIANFEQRFGIRLFDRGRSGVVLTSIGKLVAEEAERVLGSARNLEHNLTLYGAGEAGRIAIGLGPLAASLILPRLSQTLLNTRPALQMRASIGTAEDLLQELLDDEIEMIFANSWRLSASPELTVTPIGAISLARVVRASHPLTHLDKVQMSDLQPFPVANAVEHSMPGQTITSGSFVCDNYHILRETVLGTDCVWLASPDLMADDLENGRLVLLDIEDFGPIENKLSMIRRRGRTMSPAAEAVADSVQTICS